MENSFCDIATKYAGMHFPVFGKNEYGERYSVKHIYDNGVEQFVVTTYRNDDAFTIDRYYQNGKFDKEVRMLS